MSQCVPSWDLDDGPSHHLQSHHPSSAITRLPMSDYEVAELTWENGHLAMHGHGGGAPRAGKPPAKDPSAGVPPWEKPRAGGTLEAVVDQATRSVVPSAAAQVPSYASGHLVPCLGAKSSYHPLRAPPVPATMDALVPSSNLRPHGGSGGGGDDPQPCPLVPDPAPCPADGGRGICVQASCSGRKRTRLGAGDGNCSVTGSAASLGRTFDTCEINGAGDDTGFATSSSPIDGSPETENTSCGRPLAHVDDHDSVCHSRRITQRDGRYEEQKTKGDKGRSSVSTKRSRAAAVHNQSERKRRDRINQKMKTLQKLVPNSSKTDKASILDEAIEYLKQLQAQLQMMSRMSSVPHMMMPMTMQHMQMAMMAQMAQMAQMGMGMGMGMMDMSTLGRAEQSGVAPVLPTAPPLFHPPSGSWPDHPSGDRLQAPAAGGAAVLPGDPFAPFMAASQNLQQPTTVDAYGRMAALYRQLYQQPPGLNSNT